MEDKGDEYLRFGKAEGLIRRSEVSLYESDNPKDTHFFFMDLESFSQKSEFDSNLSFYIGGTIHFLGFGSIKIDILYIIFKGHIRGQRTINLFLNLTIIG